MNTFRRNNAIKRISIVLLAVFFLSIFNGYYVKPVYAAIPEIKEIDPEQYYGRQQLAKMTDGSNLVKAYDAIANGVEEYVTTISISEYSLTPLTLDIVFDAYINDYPQHFWRQNGYSYSYSGTKVFTISPSYALSASKLDAAKKSFENAVNEVVKDIDMSMTEFERELIVHDRLAERIVYNLDTPYAHDAYGAFVEGKAVCEGYARAFQYALYKIGIKATTVTGTAGEAHAWNLVNIDGKYYYTDLTWNDQNSRTYHAYFNLPESEMSRDHTVESDIELPECISTDANYFKIFGGWLDSYDVDNISEILRKDMTGDIYLACDKSNFGSWYYENIGAIASNIGISGACSYGYSSMGQEYFIECKGTRADKAVTAVQLDRSEYTLEAIGDKFILNASVLPSDAYNKDVTYKSDNTNVAVVNKYTGEVTAVGNGSAVITVTTSDGSKEAHCVVNVKEKEIKNGWLKENGKWFYFENDSITTDWKKLDGKWYYFNLSGEMQTGWQLIDDSWYYLGSSGEMRTGWLKENGKWYYFDQSGEMQSGWKYIDEKWYYFEPSGYMVTGWKQVGEKWYFFDNNGSMQASRWIGGVYLLII